MPSTEGDPIGARLRRARQGAHDGRGVDLAQVAQLVGISESHLRNIENGIRRLTPDLHQQIVAALTALGADPATLPAAPGETP